MRRLPRRIPTTSASCPRGRRPLAFPTRGSAASACARARPTISRPRYAAFPERQNCRFASTAATERFWTPPTFRISRTPGRNTPPPSIPPTPTPRRDWRSCSLARARWTWILSPFSRNTRGRTVRAQALADMHPGFIRFPGGCIVEGSVLARRYQWKNTIGPLEDRKVLINRWNYEFVHRPTPDYFQSFGLGFYEYFQLCEDIGAQPLPILNCGMACQFNSGELCPMDQLDVYIQDALDLVEFANGSATSEWGARRAAMGHPGPFHMTMLGVGNEQWGPQYMERYARFSEVFRVKHPEITLVAAAGPSPSDQRFIYAWQQMRSLKADLIDEHCYAEPRWFLDHANRYDSEERSGPRVFMGEYAAQSVATVSPKNRNNLECALAEAAFMTGLERNADVVRMASYAPLFARSEER